MGRRKRKRPMHNPRGVWYADAISRLRQKAFLLKKLEPYRSGRSIAMELGVSCQSVYNWLKKAGVISPPARPLPNQADDNSEQDKLQGGS